MLKEVDAKIYAPEAQLGQLLNDALRAPLPPRIQHHHPKEPEEDTASIHVPSSNATTSSAETVAVSRAAARATHGPPEPLNDWGRRNTFHKMRQTLAGMLATLDEKNHVLNTANDGLDKQLKRCDSSYPYIKDEISEDARDGSMTHWAYTDKTAEKKGMIGAERTRRAAVAQAALHEAEGAAVRSSQRREAVADRKRNTHVIDSDFDDTRIGKRAQTNGKGRKAAENAVGLGIINNGAPPSKRRKTEKPSAGSFPQGKAMASVYGDFSATGRGAVSSPKGLSVIDGGKKKGRTTAAVNGTGRRRLVLLELFAKDMLTYHYQRVNTNASAANSPSLASSPVVGTFGSLKDRQGRSPAPATMQRIPSARARQNSTPSIQQLARHGSSSTNHKGAAVNGLYGSTADVDKVPGSTSKSTADVKVNRRESLNAKGEHLVEANATEGAGSLRNGPAVSKVSDRSVKREESVNGHGRTRPPSISISTRGGNSKAASSTATPINNNFAEPKHRPRREVPQKRSHKKGAGLAAQLKAANTAHEDENSSMQGDDVDDEDDEDEEPRYCYCNDFSYGEMVGCDGRECKREWFHLACVGLDKAPAKNGKLSFPESLATGQC